MKAEAEVLQAKESRDRLVANGIDVFVGNAEFSNSEIFLTELKSETNSILRVSRPTECIELEAKNVCIATGSRPNKPKDIDGVDIPFSPGKVVCSTEIANLAELPNAVAIWGGGVIAIEYATVFATLGVGVTLFCKEGSFLPFLEEGLRGSLREQMKKNHILFVEDYSIEAIVNNSDRVLVSFNSKHIKNGKEYLMKRVLKIDIFLYSGGRDCNSVNLGLENVDVDVGKYGRILVDKKFKTTSKKNSIYAVGDVIGPPMLASSAQAQARRVAEQLFANDEEKMISVSEDEDMDVEIDEFFSTNKKLKEDEATLFGDLTGDKVNDAPLTLWSIPEISSVGISYEALSKTNKNNIYEGYAFFKDTARGRLSGSIDGYVKVVCKRLYENSHVIVGVHIYGEGANELIQLGALLIHSKMTVQTVSKTPFAAVTLTGLFQNACDDCLRKISKEERLHDN